MIPIQEPSSQSPKRLWNFFKSLYYDPFRWSLVKSFSMFFAGIRIAREFKGFELMPAQAPAVVP